MKTKLIILSICSLFIFGCDFIEEDDRGGITNDKFYATAKGYETLITASYNSLRGVYRTTPWLLVAGTDMYQMSKAYSQRDIQEYVTLYSTNTLVRDFYKACYDGIQIVNMSLYYNSLPDISSDQKQIYQAELRFLRALYHFLLVEQFGGVFINDEATLSPRMDLPRKTLQECYDFIITEMEDCLPFVGSDNAKVNKRAINHYLAKVYLTRGWDLKQNSDFQKAKEYATAAIDNKVIDIPFEKLWSSDNENNAEFLFSVQFDSKSIPTPDGGTDQQSLFAVSLGGNTQGHKSTTKTIDPSWSLYSYFAENDARYDATFMLIIYDKYFDYYDSDKDKSTSTIRAAYPRVWGREFTDADRDQWMLDHSTNIIPDNFEWHPFKNTEEGFRVGYDMLEFISPVVKKFDCPQTRSLYSSTASVRDIVLARLAESYFLYAEACIGLNDFATAAEYVQKVLDRPDNAKDGIKLLPNNDIASATTQSQALDYFLVESAKEFVGEYLRWPELRRTGKLKEFCGKYNYDIKKIGVDIAFKGVDGNDKIYRPIPQEAIDINQADITQNPGYSN